MEEALMTILFGLTPELVNTQFAPIAALSVYYQAQHLFEPLEKVSIEMKTIDFSPSNKLIQVFLSILTGCEYLSEVNTRLRPERQLAQLWNNEIFAHQSTLAETLDGLTLAHLSQVEAATRQIYRPASRTQRHDWRGFLWLDFDLSGLPCGQQADGSQKGYFSGKKTALAGN
jgi:hypothetical protein